MNMHLRPPSILPATDSFHIQEVNWVRHWNDFLFSFAITRPPSFRFRSGEFVMLGMSIDDKPLMRAYSMASPSYGDELEFLSIKVPDGPLTSHLCRIQDHHQLYLGKKSTGTLTCDALLPGKRLFLLSTGTGLAPFLSIVRDPEVYEKYDQIVLVHCVRHVADLAYRDLLESQLANDPLVKDDALLKLHYIPTVTREPFRTTGRIGELIENGKLFGHPIGGPAYFDPEADRIMMCGSMDMIKQFSAYFEDRGFLEGANSHPAHFVIERAFVG